MEKSASQTIIYTNRYTSSGERYVRLCVDVMVAEGSTSEHGVASVGVAASSLPSCSSQRSEDGGRMTGLRSETLARRSGTPCAP